MAKAGDLIENPATGERITFLQTTTRPTASCCASSTSFLPVSPYPSTSTPTRRSATRSSLARSEAAWEAKSGTTEKARGWLAQRVCPTLGKTPAGTSSCVSSASCVYRLYSRPSWRHLRPRAGLQDHQAGHTRALWLPCSGSTVLITAVGDSFWSGWGGLRPRVFGGGNGRRT
jgi:hypothetical protein